MITKSGSRGGAWIKAIRRTLRARGRHFAILLPLGAIVGGSVGALFSDIWFGLCAGLILGVLFGGLFTLRAR